MRVRVGGVTRTGASAFLMLGGAPRQLTRAVGYYSGQARSLVVFTSPLTVSVTPVVVAQASYPREYVTTNPATATPSGGAGPFTYSWTAGNTPTLASTTFSETTPRYGMDVQDYTVTVTDALGNTANASGVAQFFGFEIEPPL